MALNSGIQTYQILTIDDEVCIPNLSSILIAVSNLFHFYEDRTIFTIFLRLNSFKKCIELQNTIKREKKKIRVVALLNFRAPLHFATNSTFVLMIKIVIIYFYCLPIFFGSSLESLYAAPDIYVSLFAWLCYLIIINQ